MARSNETTRLSREDERALILRRRCVCGRMFVTADAPGCPRVCFACWLAQSAAARSELPDVDCAGLGVLDRAGRRRAPGGAAR